MAIEDEDDKVGTTNASSKRACTPCNSPQFKPPRLHAASIPVDRNTSGVRDLLMALLLLPKALLHFLLTPITSLIGPLLRALRESKLTPFSISPFNYRGHTAADAIASVTYMKRPILDFAWLLRLAASALETLAKCIEETLSRDAARDAYSSKA